MKIAILSDATKYARLALDLRSFLHNTITLEQSKQVIPQRLRNRETNFLSLVQKGIFENPKNPYTKLFKIASCEFGDIETMVKRDGVETTLHKLFAEGIYISWEEFKGKKDVVRGGNHLRFRETDFDNPFLASYYQVRSSGSRSAGTRTQFDLRRNRTLATIICLHWQSEMLWMSRWESGCRSYLLRLESVVYCTTGILENPRPGGFHR